jgi:hypothetical protein
MVTTVAAMAAVFGIDLLLPLGVAVGMLYVIPVLLSLQLKRPRLTLLVGCGSTALTIVGYLISPPGGIQWLGMTNRAFSIIAIWVTVVLLWQRAEADERIEALQSLLPICASCKKIRDDKGYWSQVDQYFEANTNTVFTHSLCPHCTRKWYPELHPELVERYPHLFKEA